MHITLKSLAEAAWFAFGITGTVCAMNEIYAAQGLPGDLIVLGLTLMARLLAEQRERRDAPQSA